MGFSPGNFRPSSQNSSTPREQQQDRRYKQPDQKHHRKPTHEPRRQDLFLARQIVTTMLSSVVAVTQNSPRTRQSAQRKGLVRHGLVATALPLRHSLLTGYLSPTSGFLIANPRLKSRLSSNPPSQLQISNRERMAICRFIPSSRPALFRLSLATRHSVVLRRPKTNEASLATAFLIVTPRLESPATPTKQNSNPISNRYKSPFFAPLSRSSPITRHSSRLPVAPTSRKAIMCRNHFTQFPRFKPLMRKVTNADSNQS